MTDRDLDLTEIWEILREDLRKNTETIEESMIRASNKCDVKYSDLLNAYEQNGLIGVYNLGMKHMYEYLKGK